MSIILSIKDLFQDLDFYKAEFLNNKVFIVPTDTIYGIACLAKTTNISILDRLKNRQTGKYYSILAPSRDRIDRHFDLTHSRLALAKEDMQMHSGVTRLLPKPDILGWISDNGLVGVRMIDHRFQDFLNILDHPIIATSANISGQSSNIGNISDIDDSILSQVDYIIDSGILPGRPSVILDINHNPISRFQ